MKKITLEPIGIIHSPFKERNDVPFQAYASTKSGEIEVFEKYEKGLKKIEKYNKLEIYFYFHKSRDFSLRTIPHGKKERRGVFTTRSPNRPNYIGNSVVKLLERYKNKLRVQGVDMLDGSPLLDIKPYDSTLYD